MKPIKTLTLALALATGAALPLSTFADHHEEHRHYWHGDMDRWRGGHWVHDEHEGHLGWWWAITGMGLWYLYSQPVYPYPDPYGRPTVVTPAVVVPSPAPMGPPPTQYWYYCASAKAYYPYVPSCPEGWKAVPAVPPGVPAK